MGEKEAKKSRRCSASALCPQSALPAAAFFSLSLSLSLTLAVLLPAPVLTCEVDRGASVIVVALVSQAR